MKIGIMVGEGSGAKPDLQALLGRGRLAEAAGLDTAWIAHIGLDAITAAAVLGSVTRQIEIGTAVVPIVTRHPVAMIQQTASTQQACGGRFTLGVGMAHKFVVENMWGLSYDKPARQMRKYLEVLAPQLSGEPLRQDSAPYPVNLSPPAANDNTSVLVAALGPAMLKLTGQLADGTITWATGIKTLETHIVPGICTAAEDSGRPAPRIVAGLPVLLTSNVDAARELAASRFSVYAKIPSYRAMLDREGVAGVEDLAIIGDEQTVRDGISRLSSAGVTDLCVFPFETEDGEVARTTSLLADIRR